MCINEKVSYLSISSHRFIFVYIVLSVLNYQANCLSPLTLWVWIPLSEV